MEKIIKKYSEMLSNGKFKLNPKLILLFFFLISSAVSAQPEFTKISSMPGAFSRIGFGPRGAGMGNAMSAVINGGLSAYYNPAGSVFQQGNSFSASYSILSLDRSLNFLNFTRKFEFGRGPAGKPRSTAGLSVGIINSGVSKIDGRDNNGIATGDLSTSENQFFLGLANRFSDKFSAGITIKFYYYKLYEDISASGLGFDLGILYLANPNLSFSFVVQDINSKYEWDTAPVYGQDGSRSIEKFPLSKKIGAAYYFDGIKLLTSIEFENSNAGTNIIRFGTEYEIIENLFVRGGIDQLNLSNFDFPVRPSAGFSYFYNLGNWFVGVDYAFVIEPYSPSDRHIVGIAINF